MGSNNGSGREERLERMMEIVRRYPLPEDMTHEDHAGVSAELSALVRSFPLRALTSGEYWEFMHRCAMRAEGVESEPAPAGLKFLDGMQL